MVAVTIIFHPAFLRLAIVGCRHILANAGSRVKDDSLNLNIFPLLLGSDCVLIFFLSSLCHSICWVWVTEALIQICQSLRLYFYVILWLRALTAALIADALCLCSSWHVDSFCNAFCEKHSLAWFNIKPLAQTDFNLPCQKEELLLEAMK